ncbi:ABC transporter substrate-binding protein [Hafnia paralvei]|uniref:ABC transporter substrate-binding protein n=1 Tax=Hafnia paralvei TaxID=546367 RepID=UPI003CFB5CEC
MARNFNRLALVCMLALSVPAIATTYPLTVTDTSGQTLTLKHEPKRIVVQDGRDIMTLALLDRADPFSRIVAWNNLLKKSDPETLAVLNQKWPGEADKIPDMGFSDKGEVNLESVIARKPDLMIAQLRAKPALADTGVLKQLAALNVPVLFVDTYLQPIANTQKSIQLLGEVLNREHEAKEYTDFYQKHLQEITSITAKVTPKPRVFMEAKAGVGGADACCFTHGHVGFGGMIEAIDAENLGSALLPGANGDIAIEKVISLKPDVYIISGARWKNKNSIAVPFGYGVTQKQVDDGFTKLEARNGFNQIKAVKENRLYGMYHNFYNHPYNIVGLDYLAKFIYPQQFEALDPAQTYRTIISTFTQIPPADAIFGAQAPVNK